MFNTVNQAAPRTVSSSTSTGNSSNSSVSSPSTATRVQSENPHTLMGLPLDLHIAIFTATFSPEYSINIVPETLHFLDNLSLVNKYWNTRASEFLKIVSTEGQQGFVEYRGKQINLHHQNKPDSADQAEWNKSCISRLIKLPTLDLSTVDASLAHAFIDGDHSEFMVKHLNTGSLGNSMTGFLTYKRVIGFLQRHANVSTRPTVSIGSNLFFGCEGIPLKKLAQSLLGYGKGHMQWTFANYDQSADMPVCFALNNSLLSSLSLNLSSVSAESLQEYLAAFSKCESLEFISLGLPTNLKLSELFKSFSQNSKLESLVLNVNGPNSSNLDGLSDQLSALENLSDLRLLTNGSVNGSTIDALKESIQQRYPKLKLEII